jgi:spore photoproduct lyase
MIRTIYIERQVAKHPRTREVLARLRDAQIIECDSYAEIFNPKNQNFRLQKKQPSLIIARKSEKRILRAPDSYGIGGQYNYYFSHMLNCIYDCRYCFLQGMYQSANYVLFINYEDFFESIDRTLETLPKKDVWFFSGYDCDSLALDPITGFSPHLLRFLDSRPRAFVELRTKSTQIRALLSAPTNPNVIVAFTLSPKETAINFERKAPTIMKRLQAMKQLSDRGWLLGLRFDPLIFDDTFERRYRNLFQEVFSMLPVSAIHSITLGAFRMPKRFFKNLVGLYPDESLFAGPFNNRKKTVSYSEPCEEQMIRFCIKELKAYIPADRIFSCSVNMSQKLHKISPTSPIGSTQNA